MDTRTSLLVDSLDPLALELLLALLEKGQSEKDLVGSLSGRRQPTVHKKLKRLEEVGLVHQVSAGRGAPWHVTAAGETADLLAATFALGDALEELDRRKRSKAKARLAGVGRQSTSLSLVSSKGEERG